MPRRSLAERRKLTTSSSSLDSRILAGDTADASVCSQPSLDMAEPKIILVHIEQIDPIWAEIRNDETTYLLATCCAVLSSGGLEAVGTYLNRLSVSRLAT
nr:unnamed protein product [Spirometra erinaceieuropaei]